MAIDVRELYHFAISASAIDPDLAAFIQESNAFEIVGGNAQNPIPTSAAYVIEHEGFRIEGQKEDRPVVHKGQWYEIEGLGETGTAPVIVETVAAQIEGHYPDRPSIIKTQLYQITS